MSQLYGHLKETGQTQEFHPLEATKQPDGTYILKVDTELTLDGGNINITNLKVGSTDQTAGNAKYLKTDADGVVFVTGTLGGALGVPKHYNANAEIIAAVVNFAALTKSLIIENLGAVADIFVSFDGGTNTHTIEAGSDLSIDTAVNNLDISASVDSTPYQILTTE